MSARHRQHSRSPIPMGSTAEYTCVCGKQGTYETIERHIAEYSDGDESTREAVPTAPYGQVVDSDTISGDTMVNYLPNEPREPAPTGESPPLQRAATPDPLPPPPSTSVVDERSIAELFQDMLWAAYQAGATSASSGETFETWYQREVLQ